MRQWSLEKMPLWYKRRKVWFSEDAMKCREDALIVYKKEGFFFWGCSVVEQRCPTSLQEGTFGFSEDAMECSRDVLILHKKEGLVTKDAMKCSKDALILYNKEGLVFWGCIVVQQRCPYILQLSIRKVWFSEDVLWCSRDVLILYTKEGLVFSGCNAVQQTCPNIVQGRFGFLRMQWNTAEMF